MLEPDAVKVARPVLRGAGDSDILPPTRLPQPEIFSDELWFAPSEVSEQAEHRAVSARLGQSCNGGADRVQPSFDDRLDPLQDPEHPPPPSCCFDTTHLSCAEGV